MNKIYNRLAGYEMTDLLLKLNNYTEGFFQDQGSSFFQKRHSIKLSILISLILTNY